MAELLKQPIILWEETSRSRKTANRFLDSAGIGEEQLHVVARINDQEAVKNLVAGGLGISLISERAARNFVEEKRVLQFDLPVQNTRRLYLAHRRECILSSHMKEFLAFARKNTGDPLRRAGRNKKFQQHKMFFRNDLLFPKHAI